MPRRRRGSHNSSRLHTRAVASELSAWYEKAHRRLPWRQTQDPYAIWISEVMLQQTRVEKVLPYFVRFLARFPNLRGLASSTLEEVLKLWEGLGYYGRARNLLKASREIEALGGWPRTAAELAKLPGIGRRSRIPGRAGGCSLWQEDGRDCRGGRKKYRASCGDSGYWKCS